MTIEITRLPHLGIGRSHSAHNLVVGWRWTPVRPAFGVRALRQDCGTRTEHVVRVEIMARW